MESTTTDCMNLESPPLHKAALADRETCFKTLITMMENLWSNHRLQNLHPLFDSNLFARDMAKMTFPISLWLLALFICPILAFTTLAEKGYASAGNDKNGTLPSTQAYYGMREAVTSLLDGKNYSYIIPFYAGDWVGSIPKVSTPTL